MKSLKINLKIIKEYALAVISSVAIFLIKIILFPSESEILPFFLVIIPIILSSLYGGMGPGIASMIITEIFLIISIDLKIIQNIAQILLFNIESLVIIYIISREKRLKEKITQVAYYDSLTGIPNRIHFYTQLEKKILEASRTESNFAIFFIDLDKFKEINDGLGHEAGDILLKKVSERLKNSVRRTDIAARLGGDEFAVIISDFDRVLDTFTIANKIIKSVGRSYKIKNKTVTITVSIGIALYPLHGESVDQIVRLADTAMYTTKKKGGNNYELFTSP